MKLLNYIILFFFYFLENNTVFSISEHYWRDYDGLIPADAIQGGTDEFGKPTYIGQFSVVGKDLDTIPATISRGSRKAIGAHNSGIVESNSSSNLKILCSTSPDSYQWKAITEPFPADCQAIIGGYEDNSELLIGRVTQDGHLVTGKVFENPRHNYAGLITPHINKEIKYNEYDLFVYCS